MIKVLSLDVSSSTIGWSVLKYDEDEFELLHYGYIKPPKKEKGSISFRLNSTIDTIKKLIKEHIPDEIAIEDYAKKFSQGKSTANTIIILSTFNEVVCLSAYQELQKDVFRYPVITIRSTAGKLFEEKIVSKDDIFPVITKHSKIFTVELNKNSNIKKESGDVVDAIAVGITHIIKRGCNAKRYYI